MFFMVLNSVCYVVPYTQFLALHFDLLASISGYRKPVSLQIMLQMHCTHSGTMAEKLQY